MSLRALVRTLILCLSLTLWPVLSASAGPVPILAGLGLLVLTVGYLWLQTRRGEVTRWHLRYDLPHDAELADLQWVIDVLACWAGHLVIEANRQGLFLEVPRGFERYVEAQLHRVLPGCRLTATDGSPPKSGGSSFLYHGQANRDLLRWATEDGDRQIRLHVHPGSYGTVLAQTHGVRPPGAWLRLPLPRLLAQVWHNLPLWDELSAGEPLGDWLPFTEEGDVFASRARSLRLNPPDSYQPDPRGRSLGLSADGRVVNVDREMPLFTVGASPAYLSGQILDDLAAGQATIVISPHRRLLHQLAADASETMVHWLDAHDVRHSIHLPIARAEDLAEHGIVPVIETLRVFLADLGVSLHLPAVADFFRQVLYVLVAFAHRTEQGLAFTELQAICNSPQALQAFVSRVHESYGDLGAELLDLLDSRAGYAQAVSTLSALRAAFQPLAAGSQRTLCQPPFADLSEVLHPGSLLLVPMTYADLPEQDRLLSAMLDLVLTQALGHDEEQNVALHLHNAYQYRRDEGRRWVEASQKDPRLSLVLDVQDLVRYQGFVEDDAANHVLFRLTEPLAAKVIDRWRVPASVAALTELSHDVALAHLPGMVVTLKEQAR